MKLVTLAVNLCIRDRLKTALGRGAPTCTDSSPNLGVGSGDMKLGATCRVETNLSDSRQYVGTYSTFSGKRNKAPPSLVACHAYS